MDTRKKKGHVSPEDLFIHLLLFILQREENLWRLKKKEPVGLVRRLYLAESSRNTGLSLINPIFRHQIKEQRNGSTRITS